MVAASPDGHKLQFGTRHPGPVAVRRALVALLVLSLAGCGAPLDGPAVADPTDEPARPPSQAQSVLPGVIVPPPSPAVAAPSVRFLPVARIANEPTVAVSDDGTLYYQAYETTLRSRDGGASWQVVFELDEAAVYHTLSADPFLHRDPDTGRLFVLHMASVVCNSLAHSDDGGDTWLMRELVACASPGIDHPKLATGPWREPRPDGPLYTNAVYLCYNKLREGPFCSVSLDGGLTFQSEMLVELGDCGASPGHLVAGLDGTVYLPFSIACDRPRVAVSQDNGLTWTVQLGPATGPSQDVDPDMAVAPDGTAWIEWQGGDNLRYVARSRDQFATWEGPWVVSTTDLLSTAQGTIVAGPAGVAVAFFGTRDAATVPREAPANTTWDLFLAHADGEGEPRWTTTQLTSNPVQVGCIWELTGSGCRNLGDFFDMAVDPEGHPVVAFVDGCEAECAGPRESWPDQSTGDQGWIALVNEVRVT